MRSSRFEEACAVSVLVSLVALAWGQPDVVIDTTIQLQRDRIVVGTVQTLTTFANESELSADANGATFLQGFRFWVDQTNQQGGITLGTRKVQVELAYYDDQGDSEKAVECYKRLLEQKGAHFIFGGGVLGTDALLGVANSSNILTMLTQESKYSEGWHPLLFDMHSRPGPDILPEVSDFLFRIAEAHNFTRLLFFFTRENPLAASPCISAVEHARSSGRFSSATAINQTAPWLWKDHITRHRPEILIACTDTSNEVEFVMNELVSQRILYGWDTSAQDWYNPTVVESTTSLNFAFFMRGAGTSDFFATAKGWSNFVSGSVAWAPQLGYTDPYFGDSVRTNQVFKARGDFGDGRDMHPRAAAAVGAGVVLQLAIEAAQSVESGAVAAAMRGLDQETVYGQVRFDERQQNVGHHSAMFQWQCDHQADYLTSASNLIPCKQKIVHPFERATGLLRLLPKACPQNQIHTELLAVFEDPEDAIYTLDYEIDDLGGVIEILQEDVLEGTEAAGCEYCVTANPKLIEDLKQHGGDNAVSLGDACRVFRDTVSVGALFTSHTDAATISALLYARQVVVDSLEILPNIPLHLSFVESSTLLEGNATLIADSLRSVVVEAEATAPRTGFVWSSGQAATMQDYVPEIFTHVTGVEGARNLESKTMFTWGNTSVSIVPAIFQQGRGLFRLVEHFGWNRCRLIRGSEPAFQAMGDKFVSSAAELGDQITVFQDILIPAVGDGRREQVLLSLQEMDDCHSRILVLCVGATDAQAIFESLKNENGDGTWSGKWVVIASEEAAHATNLPPGLLSLRSVARSDAGKFADLSLHLTNEIGREFEVGGKGASVSNVQPAPESSVEKEDDDGDRPGVHSGGVLVEDRAYFAFDAYIALSMAVWQMMLSHEDVASEGALRRALSKITFEGASGTVEFNEDLQRTNGRYALLNWDGAYWVSLAYWDLGGSGVIIHTEQPGLRQSRWETETVAWPRKDGTASFGRKPLDMCDCVLFSQMPATSFDLAQCEWGLDGILYTSGALLCIVLGVGCIIRRCNQRSKGKLDWEEEQLRADIAKLRARLHITRKEGFILSSEPQTMRLPWMRELKVLQRSHVEAVARMAQLVEFDVRAFDAFASCFYSGERMEHESPTAKKKAHVTFQADIFKSFTKMADPRGDRPYIELRKLLIETAARLLKPEPPHLSGKAVRGSEQGSSKTTTSLDSTQSNHSLEPRPRSWSLFGQSRSADSRQRERTAPRNAQERFHYFLQYVTKVQMWAENDHQLFHTLQHTVVQGMMDKLRSKCDSLFERIKNEELGSELTHFTWPPSAPLLPSPSGPHGPPGRLAYDPVVLANDESNDRDVPAVLSNGHELEEEGGEAEARLVLAASGRATLEHEEAESLGEGVPVEELVGGGVQALLTRAQGLLPRSESSPSTKGGGARKRKLNYACITRQDHPAVQAIRLDEEGRKEVALQRSNPAVGLAEMATNHSVEILDEDLYVTALRRRALLLNEGFQSKVRAAVERRFGAEPIEVVPDEDMEASRRNEEESTKRRSWGREKKFDLEAGGFGGGSSRKGRRQSWRCQHLQLQQQQQQHEAVLRAVHVVERVHAAPVKTKARMQEKLFAYAAPDSSPHVSNHHRNLAPPPDVGREEKAWEGKFAGAEGERRKQEHPLTANILDPVRCTVVCRGAKEILEHARWLIADGEALGLPVVRVKNKFAMENSDEYDGYRDMMLCVLYTGDMGLRIISEVQLHDVRLHELKLQMHKLYKVKRAASAVLI